MSASSSLPLPGPFNLSAVDKWDVQRALVNGEEALLLRPKWGAHHPTLTPQVYRYAIIPDGWYLVETETEYLGLRHATSGEYRELRWDLVPGGAQVQLIHVLT